MQRMLVVVFDDEDKAYRAFRGLQRLDEDGIIALNTLRLISKDSGGAITVSNSYDVLPQATMGATAVGSLIGMLGGPVGLAAGAVSGFMIGATTDFARSHVIRNFVADVMAALVPEKSAIVAEIDEEGTGPIDARMETLGGSVFRRELSDVTDAEYEHEVATIEEQLARTKARYAAAHAELKATLQARIDSLNRRLHEKLDRAKASIQRESAR